MIVNEKALVSAMKDSYKGGGYSVAFGSGQVFVSGNSWSVWCAEDELPRKVLGMIAEHLGKIDKIRTKGYKGAFRFDLAIIHLAQIGHIFEHIKAESCGCGYGESCRQSRAKGFGHDRNDLR